MRHLRVFRYLGSTDGRLGFYTLDTRDRIPELPGCYAWFLPLWLYRENLDELMQIVSNLLNYDTIQERQVDAAFTWKSVQLHVRRRTVMRSPKGIRTNWQRPIEDKDTKDALQQAPMEASLLMPPSTSAGQTT